MSDTAKRNGKADVIGNVHKKPTTHPIDRDAIPDALMSFDRWLGWLWKWDKETHKWTKKPVNARTGGSGKTNKPATWSTFEQALAAMRDGRCNGIGFVLGEADAGLHFAGIDVDDCRELETGELSDVARDIIGVMDTYCEVSPTETGIKLLCIGTLPEGHHCENDAKTIEVYTRGRYFTVTGRRVEGTPERVEARQKQLTEVWQRYIGSEQVESSSAANSATNGHASADVLRAMLRHKRGADRKDGSKRKYLVCCRMVEFDLSDEAAVEAFHEYEKHEPFPKNWSDSDIIACMRDAEKNENVERGSAVVIANYEAVEIEDAGGKKKTVNVPRSMNEIIDTINKRMGEWPRRVDNVLFVDDPKHGLDYFDRRTTAGLFGWLKRHRKVTWATGGSMVSQSELFAEFERTAQRYDAIEVLPHEPPMEGIYYHGEAPPPGDGSHLRKLLDRFRPETTIDRDLIQAAFMTALWGGPAGTRPAFVVTSDDGRGIGKSQIPQLVAELCGGSIDASPNDKMESIKTRLLSSDGCTKRIALLDNVKSLKFSWAELESLITNPIISGHRLYVGEGQRPNLVVWFITLNGVDMATDMAQRSIIIKVVKGKNDGPWFEQTRDFIKDHRAQIIGDIIACLRAEPFLPEKFSFGRWATWERHVLSRLPEPGDAQKLIRERQDEANCDLEDAEIIEGFFAEQLSKLGYDPNTAQVRIPVAVVARWYGWAVGEAMKTTGVTRTLNRMAKDGTLKRIARDTSRTYDRCFIWTGPAADIIAEPIENTLLARIAQFMDSKDGSDA